MYIFFNLPIHYSKVEEGFNAKKPEVTKLVCEINWINVNFRPFYTSLLS